LAEFEERWDRFRDLVEHLFREPGRGSVGADVLWYPATDAYETERSFVIRMELSGVRKEDVVVRMENDVVQVRGIRLEQCPEGPRTYHRMEIAVGPFVRGIRVPERFAGGEASAAYRDGILEITIGPRRRPGTRDLAIPID